MLEGTRITFARALMGAALLLSLIALTAATTGVLH
jgi:hypothetical protein